MIFENDREREVYEAEKQAMNGSKGWYAERCAEHAVELHRQLITHRRGGVGDDGRQLAGQPCGAIRRKIRGDVPALVERLQREACTFFGPYPGDMGLTKCSHKTAPWRWFAMTALRRAFGSTRASEAMHITDAGIRTGERRLREKSAEAYAAALKAGERIEAEQESEAA
jgi:hypothetical protein